MKPSDDLGVWLSATMRSRGLSQADVAREVGVADAQVSRWRRGQVRPSIPHLQRIADTFQVPRADLERMAGYPMPVREEGSGRLNPEEEAELRAYEDRFARLLEDRVPRELWRAYSDACEALAESLSASFRDAEARVREEQEGQREHRHVGFRTQE